MKSIRKLKIQHSKLEQVYIRLHKRDKTLFRACTFALEKKNNARAAMCANELAEVRKLIKLLSHTQIAIERIIIRLDTIKELSTIMVDLKPALNALKNVTTNLVSIMPDIASELDKVNNSIQETLTVTKLSSEPPTILTNMKTAAGQEILKEVNMALQQKLNVQLPEPPVSEVLPKIMQPERIKEMVALVAACPQSSGDKQKETTEAFLSIKDVKMQSISLRIQHSESMQDKLLEYVKQCNGQIDVTECALKLKIPPKEVEKTLKELDAKGKIIIGTC
ncbi:Snf7 family protein [Candidatus Bathyarchaeota archaeon]|nr:Snf7 family protein [Candidatus Bathyarchaeota archaeon]